MRNFFVKWRVTCDSRASLQTPSGVFLRNTHEVDTYLQRADKKDYRSLGLSHRLWRDMSLQQMTSFDEEAFFGNYFSFNIFVITSSKLESHHQFYNLLNERKKRGGRSPYSKRKYFTIFSKLWFYYLDRGQLVKVSE